MKNLRKNKKKKNFKEKGITLVALTITIVIILILAGVTIGTISGEEGLIARIKKAVENYKEASTKEDKDLEILSDRVEDIKKNTGTGGNSTLSKESVYYKTIDDDEIPIPQGFYYVGGVKESGIVISDNQEDENKYQYDVNKQNKDVPSGADEAYNEDGTINEEKLTIKGNQFVWIPCDTKNYKKIDFQMTNSTIWQKKY